METKLAEENVGGGSVEVGGRSHPPEPEGEGAGPRVVDRRRFLKYLDEAAEAAECVEEAPRFPTYVEELQSKLKASEERLREYAEKHREARQQMQAEVDAIRARLQRTLAEQLEQRKAQFIGNLLDVLDNLNRALRAAEETQNFQGLLAGVRAIATLFERSLEAEGVSVINPLDQPFDPRFHEAVDTAAVGPDRDGLVVDVLQPGYRLGEMTLVRPAQVRVGRATN